MGGCCAPEAHLFVSARFPWFIRQSDVEEEEASLPSTAPAGHSHAPSTSGLTPSQRLAEPLSRRDRDVAVTVRLKGRASDASDPLVATVPVSTQPASSRLTVPGVCLSCATPQQPCRARRTDPRSRLPCLCRVSQCHYRHATWWHGAWPVTPSLRHSRRRRSY